MPSQNLPRSLLIERLNSSVASDSSLHHEAVETWVDLSTGRIYNPKGTTEGATGYYSNSYDLQGQDDDLEFQLYADDTMQGIHSRLVDFVSRGAPQLERTRILDVGCGKGLLLRALQRQYPSADLLGVEPSGVAVSRARRIIPDIEIWRGVLEDSPYAAMTGSFDLVLAHGVLEHVPDPDAFLRLLSSLLGEHGLLFVGVPNFSNNVADLLTIDHLTRFTPEYFKGLARRVGLNIEDELVSDASVPMWFLLSRTTSRAQSGEGREVEPWESAKIAMRNASILSWQLRELGYALQLAQLSETPLNIFGTGTIALFGLREEAASGGLNLRIFDDNPSQWGAMFLGHEIASLPTGVKPPDGIYYLNANPCYHERMRRRIREVIGESATIFPQATMGTG